MDEGHGVDHLQAAGRGHGLLDGAAHQLARRQAQRRPHALAACGAGAGGRGGRVGFNKGLLALRPCAFRLVASKSNP